MNNMVTKIRIFSIPNIAKKLVLHKEFCLLNTADLQANMLFTKMKKSSNGSIEKQTKIRPLNKPMLFIKIKQSIPSKKQK